MQRYQGSVPDYLKIEEHYLDPKNVKHPEKIAVISKNNGWLTVDSKTLNRQQAFEKVIKSSNLKQTSATSPDWMQYANLIQQDKVGRGSLIPKSTTNQLTHFEPTRIILFDSYQPLRNGDHKQSTNSIFMRNDTVINNREQQKLEKHMMAKVNISKHPPNKFTYRKTDSFKALEQHVRNQTQRLESKPQLA